MNRCFHGSCITRDSPCDDGLPCTVNEEPCQALGAGCSAEPDQNCNAACTNDAQCATHEKCTIGKCVSGQCQLSAKLCEDGNPCTIAYCSAATGQCVSQADPSCQSNGCTTNAQGVVAGCPASNPCVTYACAQNNCVTLAEVCNDLNPCTVDACDVATGTCTYTAIPNCAGCAVDKDCEDFSPCTVDRCTTATGQCEHAYLANCEVCTVATSLYICNDFDDCTLDLCGSDGLCAHIPSGTEECAVDFCSTDVDCVSGSTCAVGRCDSVTGICAFSPVYCRDGSACTKDGYDVCVEGVGCVEIPDLTCGGGAACSANQPDACKVDNKCVTAACVAGKCQATLKSCNDGDPCTFDACDGTTGTCIHEEAPPGQCPGTAGCTSDAQCLANSCQIGQCIGGMCVTHDKVCNDYLSCTVGDACDQLKEGCYFDLKYGCLGCSGDPDCDDGDVCTQDVCLGPGVCSNQPSGQPGCN